MTDQQPTQKHNNLLAWHGLTIPMQDEWHPLKIEGDHQKGSISVGDMAGPVFKLQWLRPPKNYDGRMWVDKRRKSIAGKHESENPPRPGSFEHVSWVKNLNIREEAEKTVWWGCSKRSEVLVVVLLTNLREKELNEWFIENALTYLQVIPGEQEWPWRIYSVQCTLPAGYRLQQTRMAAGDIALEFKRGNQDRLVVRQVYPASLALERRPMAGWLKDRVFNEQRRLRQETEQKQNDVWLKRKGRKPLPFPLSWLRPRRYESVIDRDRQLDRLMIVEGEWPEGKSTTPVNDILASMQEK